MNSQSSRYHRKKNIIQSGPTINVKHFKNIFKIILFGQNPVKPEAERDEVKELSVEEKQSGLERNDFRLWFPLFYFRSLSHTSLNRSDLLTDRQCLSDS